MASEMRRSGLMDYVRSAFLYHWNLGLFGAGIVASALTWPDAMLPIVAALEIAYLGTMVGIPKFREAIDAQRNAGRVTESSTPSVDEIVRGLDVRSRARFSALRQRCEMMQGLARTMHSAGASDGIGDVAGSMRVSGLNQLLWGFLRLLHHQSALQRLLESMDGPTITRKVQEVADGLEKAKLAADERIVRSFEERLATAKVRAEHFERSHKDLLFVNAELDRIEDKIQALSEMAVNQSDPNALSAQIDATAESMQATVSRLSEFQLGTAMLSLDTAPVILESRGDDDRLRA